MCTGIRNLAYLRVATFHLCYRGKKCFIQFGFDDKIDEFVKYLELIGTLPMNEFYDAFQTQFAHINELLIQAGGAAQRIGRQNC